MSLPGRKEQTASGKLIHCSSSVQTDISNTAHQESPALSTSRESCELRWWNPLTWGGGSQLMGPKASTQQTVLYPEYSLSRESMIFLEQAAFLPTDKSGVGCLGRTPVASDFHQVFKTSRSLPCCLSSPSLYTSQAQQQHHRAMSAPITSTECLQTQGDQGVLRTRTNRWSSRKENEAS